MTSIDELSEDSAYFVRVTRSARAPDAVDLIALQRRISHLTKRELELEGKSKLIPGNTRALENVRSELRQLYVLEARAKEHVWSSPEQSKIYENQKRLRAEAAPQHDKDEHRNAPSEHPQKRASLREYVERFKARRTKERDQQRGKEDELER